MAAQLHKPIVPLIFEKIITSMRSRIGMIIDQTNSIDVICSAPTTQRDWSGPKFEELLKQLTMANVTLPMMVTGKLVRSDFNQLKIIILYLLLTLATLKNH